MNQNQIVFILDAGNTSLKLGVFENGILHKTARFSYETIDELLFEYAKFNQPPVFLSTVLSEKDSEKLMRNFKSIERLTREHSLPIQINYQSPGLGFDRICNAVAANSFSIGKHSVAIDIGTCIKFDYTNNKGEYFGGSISPGIRLRYQSMHVFTGKLPLVKEKSKISMVGNSTIESLQSGVMNGIQAEIELFIKKYELEFKDLTFFVTGGDAEYFDFPLKNNIFVDQNLTLKGLYKIYELNAK